MMLKPFIFAFSASVLVGCSTLSEITSRTSNSLAKSKRSELSQWYVESLDLCHIRDTELEDFVLPFEKDLWQRVRAGFKLPPTENQRVQQQMGWYGKHPSYMSRVSERGSKYLFYIVEELEKRDMPLELALLPIVESAFDPFAYSHGSASGMWQVIPGTGTMLGLKQNWWYDGRRDIVASTDAALDYLEQLNKRFDGDWLLTLAAYNSGASTVWRAIRKNKENGKPTDYWSLGLPRETKDYVPRLLAIKALVETPEAYSVKLYPIANEPYFTAIDVGSQIDLAQAAEFAGMSMDEFYELNPGFNQWATDPEGPHMLVLPRDKADAFAERVATIPLDQRITWKRYTIERGDSLSTIANKHKTTVDALKAINSLEDTQIRAGKVLLVPMASANAQHYSFSLPQRVKRTQAKNGKGKKLQYKVVAGDSLWSIGKRYKVTSKDIAAWNNMAPGDTIRPGQTLVIWNQDKTQQASNSGVTRKVAYQVRKGDSLARIADKFNLQVDDILQWNQVNPRKYLQPGDRLTLFVDVTRTN